MKQYLYAAVAAAMLCVSLQAEIISLEQAYVVLQELEMFAQGDQLDASSDTIMFALDELIGYLESDTQLSADVRLDISKKINLLVKKINLQTRAPRLDAPEIRETTILNENYYPTRDLYLRNLLITGSLILNGQQIGGGGSVPSNLYVLKAGDTMTGDLTMADQHGIVLEDASGANAITVQAPNTTETYSFTLPDSAGAANQALTTDGFGNLTWASAIATTSGLQSINNLTTPHQYLLTSTGTSTAFQFIETSSSHILNIPYVQDSSQGYGLLDSADYNNFVNAANMVNAATSDDVCGTLVKRDANCNFSANIITATVTYANFALTSSSALTAVTSTTAQYAQVANSANYLCGVPACNLVSTYSQVLSGTSFDIPLTLVLRDSTGSFAATTITLTGELLLQNANGNLTALQAGAQSFAPVYTLILPTTIGGDNQVLTTDGNNPANLFWQPVSAIVTSTIELYGDVMGSSTANIVNTICGQSACSIVTTVTTATSDNICGTLVKRDSNCNFSANLITATVTNALLSQTALYATNALLSVTSQYAQNAGSTNFAYTSSLAQYAQVANSANYLCGVPACNLVNTYSQVLSGTSFDIPLTLVLRDSTGSFAATTITLTGELLLQNANGNLTALEAGAQSFAPVYTLILPTTIGGDNQVLTTDGNNPANLFWQPVSAIVTSTIELYGDVMGSSTANHVAFVCGVPACALAQTYSTVLSATACDIPLTLILRDSTGSFAATTITLTGNSLINYSSVGGCNTGAGFVFAPTKQNTIIGLGAGNNNVLTGTSNIAVGYQALAKNTSGYNNVALGFKALANGNTINNFDNIAIGANTLSGASILGDNVAVGTNALSASGYTGGQQIAIGTGALQANTTGTGNIAIGYDALQTNTSGVNNIAIGAYALSKLNYNLPFLGIPSGANNIAIGSNALSNIAIAGENVAIGSNTLQNGSFSYGNVAIGYNAFVFGNSAFNVAVGNSSMVSNNTGASNTAVGYYSLSGNISGNSNTAIGSYSLSGNITGFNNTAVGYNALTASVGSDLTAVGAQALQNNTLGTQNVGVGYSALQDNTIGSNSTAVGYNALINAVSSNNNTAIGNFTLNNAAVGSDNTAVGNQALSNTQTSSLVGIGSGALFNNSTGAQNVAVGYYALNANTTGGSNTALGYNVLNQSTGSNNTVVGANSGTGITSGAHNIYLGDSINNGNESNTIRIGNSNQTEAYVAGIYGTSLPSGSPVVVTSSGQLGIGSSTTVTGTSCDTALTFILRDSTGSFAATTVTLTGHSLINYSSVGGCDTGAGFVWAPTNQNTIIGLNAGNNNVITGTSNVALGYHALANAKTINNFDNIAIGAFTLTGTAVLGDNIAIGVNALSNVNYNKGQQIAIGTGALQNNTSGIQNTAVGYYALNLNTTGTSNVALGYNAGSGLITGTGNIIIGAYTAQGLTSGANNIIIGQGATAAASTASNNTTIGTLVGVNSTSSNNVVVGYQALQNDTAGNQVAVGYQALQNNTDGSQNTAVGYQALNANTTGTSNVALGFKALANGNTINNSRNIAIGANALSGSAVLGDNVAIGVNALSNVNYNQKQQIAIGTGALQDNTNGTQNIAIGYQALNANTGSGQNVVIGTEALSSVNDASSFSNVVIGHQALQTGNNTIYENVAIGYQAMQANNASAQCVAIGCQALLNNQNPYITAIGYQALQMNNAGALNTAVGAGALSQSSGQANNTAVGYSALANNSNGNNNTAVGTYALSGGAVSTGYYNVGVGVGAGTQITSGNSNTLIGCIAGTNLDSGNNNTMIGYNTGGSVTTGNNVIVIGAGLPGSNTANSTYIAGISGATASGGVEVYCNTSSQLGTVNSSRRYKENIKDLGNFSDNIYKLRPVQFNYISDQEKWFEAGLIAEEVEDVYPEIIVYNKDGEVETIRYKQVYMMMLNEQQKDHARIATLEDQCSALQQTNNLMSAQIADLQAKIEMLLAKA